MMAEVTITLCFGSFGSSKILQVHKYSVKLCSMCVCVCVFASTFMFEASEIPLFLCFLQV